MTSAFTNATTISFLDSGLFRCEIPDHWQQGRGAYGGVVLGVLVRAIEAHERDPERRIRSLSSDLCAPAMPGPAEVRVTTLRAGSSLSFVEAQLFQGGALIARASASVGAARRAAATSYSAPAPAHAPWTDLAVIPVAPPYGPVFAQHFEYRLLQGMPFAGGTEPVVEGFVREKGERSPLDASLVVGLLDSFWPSFAVLETTPRIAVTVGYTAQFLVDPKTLDGDEPLYYRARGAAAEGGYLVDFRELYAGDRLIALNQQTFAVVV